MSSYHPRESTTETTHKMFIHVKSLNGNKNQINVDEDATVKQVKLILQEKEGIPAEQLRIIFKGKLLTDTDKLKDKGMCCPREQK